MRYYTGTLLDSWGCQRFWVVEGQADLSSTREHSRS